MFKQLKDARDRFFGFGAAGTSVPVLDGALKPNNRLDKVEIFFEAPGLEDLCVTADGRLMVASASSIFHVEAQGQKQLVATLPQPVQAICKYQSGLVAATADRLHFIGGNLDGKQVQISKPPAVGCINALCEHPDGSVIISDGSENFSYSDWTRDLLSEGASGRLLQYQPAVDQVSVIRNGLKFPFGALVDDQGKIYTTESWAHRIVQLSQDQTNIVLQGFPGYPSRFIRASTSGYWLTVFAPRNQLVEFVLRETGFKQEMMATVDPRYWIAPALSSGQDFIEPLQQGGVRQMGVLKPWAPARSYGLVVRLDAGFQPLYSMHSRVGGTHHGVTAVAEFKGALLVLSKGSNKVLRIALT